MFREAGSGDPSQADSRHLNRLELKEVFSDGRTRRGECLRGRGGFPSSAVPRGRSPGAPAPSHPTPLLQLTPAVCRPRARERGLCSRNGGAGITGWGDLQPPPGHGARAKVRLGSHVECRHGPPRPCCTRAPPYRGGGHSWGTLEWSVDTSRETAVLASTAGNPERRAPHWGSPRASERRTGPAGGEGD